MKRIDLYIIKKYFLSFFFVSMIFLFIAIVIDFTEKQQQLIERAAPLPEILLYFLTFIPHIFAQLAPLFLLIGVIFFTSKMAGNTEIISILGNGISFSRFLRPYFISSLILAASLLVMHNWVVPELNKERVAFLEKYYHHTSSSERGINLTVSRDDNTEVIASLQNFNYKKNNGFYLSMEEYRNNKLVYHLRAPRVEWKPDTQKWEIRNYEEWRLTGEQVSLQEGTQMDTTLGFSPDEFARRVEVKETMNRQELKEFIAKEELRGSEKVPFYKVELFSRTSNAFAVIILTIIGATLASRKKRGGTGANIFIGLAISVFYLLFMRFSSTFATNADLHPMLAVWIPNIIFGIVAIVLVRLAPK